MPNKLLYALYKDGVLRNLIISCVVLAVSGFLLYRLNAWQSQQMDIARQKLAFVAQIPHLQAKIRDIKGRTHGLVLRGIVLDKAVPMAVINNRLVKVGSTIKGNTVTTITSKSVTVCNTISDKCVNLYL